MKHAQEIKDKEQDEEQKADDNPGM